MGDFRIRYGFALGPEGTYSTRSDKTLFPESATTPDVTTGVLFYTQNTTNTAITYFNVVGDGGQPGDSACQGKRIVVFFKDGSTALIGGVQLLVKDTSSVTLPAGTISEFLLHNSAWYETQRITPVINPFQVQAGAVVTGSFGLNVTTTNVLVLSASGGGAQLQSFSGGQVGQIVTLINNSSNTLTIAADGIGNIRAGTSALIVPNSGAVQLIHYGPGWMVIRGAAVN